MQALALAWQLAKEVRAKNAGGGAGKLAVLDCAAAGRIAGAVIRVAGDGVVDGPGVGVGSGLGETSCEGPAWSRRVPSCSKTPENPDKPELSS